MVPGLRAAAITFKDPCRFGLILALLFLTNSPVVEATVCAQCATVGYLPDIVLNQLNQFNLTSANYVNGNCTSQNFNCSTVDGGLCRKTTNMYKFSYGDVAYTWNTYVYDCYVPGYGSLAGSNPTPNNCYSTPSTNASLYTQTTQQCWCNSTNFCNGAGGKWENSTFWRILICTLVLISFGKALSY